MQALQLTYLPETNLGADHYSRERVDTFEDVS